jgi:hypothetical protein
MSQPAPHDRIGPGEATDAPDARSGADAHALDAALRATLNAVEGDERITPEELAALGEVARRFGAAALSYDPIAIELVHAIIQVNYGHLRRPPEMWRSTAAKIATLLYDSPTARARLENLWSRLIESYGRPSAQS